MLAVLALKKQSQWQHLPDWLGFTLCSMYLWSMVCRKGLLLLICESLTCWTLFLGENHPDGCDRWKGIKCTTECKIQTELFLICMPVAEGYWVYFWSKSHNSATETFSHCHLFGFLSIMQQGCITEQNTEQCQVEVCLQVFRSVRKVFVTVLKQEWWTSWNYSGCPWSFSCARSKS